VCSVDYKLYTFAFTSPIRLHGLMLSARAFKVKLTIETSPVVYLRGFTSL
jgi:hypothetical protein